MEYSEEQIAALMQGIYDETITPYDLPEDLYMAIAEHLQKAVFEGFGGDVADFSGPSQDLLEDLRDNVYMFSGAKTFQQVKEMSAALTSEDGITPFSEFKEKAMQIFDQYNKDWLQTEYSTAIGQAQNAQRWDQIQSQKETLPYLKYSAVIDDNTSDICEPLDGTTLPVDDPFWDEFMPLNHYNCRCTVLQLDAYDKAEVTPKDDVDERAEKSGKDMDNVFKMNPGKDGYVFSPEHPYFEVAKKDQDYAANNFNLPIPEAKKK